MKFSNRSHASSLLATIPLLLSAGLAQAQTTGGVKTVYLLARPLSSSETVHDAGTDVPMWGYQTCQQLSSGRVSDCTGAVQSPGPVIRMDPSETTLRIYLGSCLPNLSYLQSLNGLQSNGTALSSITTSATSIVIPDIPKALSPVTFADAEGRRRVLSFDQMAIRAPSNDEQCALEQPATLYEWTNVQPGTYLYQSGTSPQVQVQMGLYGAVIKNQSGSAPAAAGIDFGVAYDPAQ
jgi:FtsP/CotA-like multicopper oxidase with cupredoxin domain